MRTLRFPATFAALAAFSTFGLAAAAHADDRYIPRPPVLLSPDLSEPWLLQYKPAKKKAVLAAPAPRYAPARPVLVAAAPMPLPVQPAQRSTAPQPVLISAATPLPNPVAPSGQPATKRQSRSFDPAFLPTVVAYAGPEKPGTIVIDTNARYLYLVEGGGQARRYGVGVGKPGFEWAGAHTITRKAEWPDWTPPPEMIARRPELPRHMDGGPGNPLGARAMYLGSTLYRIHGTSEPWSIGKAVSSGCIRMRNEDVIDLYGRVGVGTRVIVM